MLNSQFIEMLSEVIPQNEIDSFVQSIDSPVNTFVRLNGAKPIPKRMEGTPVVWCENGVKLNKRELFTIDPFFHAGAYYVQEASSMFIEQLFKKIILKEQSSPLKILDLCAAPGGKSTHISSLIGDKSLLVANEVIKSRASILKENVIKWGIGNTIVTSNDPVDFVALPSFFDCVVVDAPCSGEGMFRKNEKARNEWSPGNVELCRSRSRRILSDVWGSVAENGYLIYSTCTFNRRENEENVKWMIDELGAEAVPLEIRDFENVLISDYGYRFHPNKVDSEGYFVAIVKKTTSTGGRIDRKDRTTPLVKEKNIDLSAWIDHSENYSAVLHNDSVWAVDKEWFDDTARIVSKLNTLYFGIEVGELFGKKLKPSHALALSIHINKVMNIVHNLSATDALLYLRRQSIDPNDMKEGSNLVGYEGVAIGWVKRIGNRTNNLYPKESRILKEFTGIFAK